MLVSQCLKQKCLCLNVLQMCLCLNFLNSCACATFLNRCDCVTMFLKTDSVLALPCYSVEAAVLKLYGDCLFPHLGRIDSTCWFILGMASAQVRNYIQMHKGRTVSTIYSSRRGRHNNQQPCGLIFFRFGIARLQIFKSAMILLYLKGQSQF